MSVKTRQALENVAISGVRGYERNAWTHSAAQIKQMIASVRTFGFTNPLLIHDQNMFIAGHRGWKRPSSSAWEPCRASEWSACHGRKSAPSSLADNQIALNSGCDDKMLDTPVRLCRSRARPTHQRHCPDRWRVVRLG